MFMPQVYRARNKITGETVALKHVIFSSGSGPRRTHATREAGALSSLSGKTNIIRCLGVIQGECSVSLILQHCKTDLFSILKYLKENEERLDPAMTKTIMFQLLQALSVCHEAGFAHRDISPTNLLFDACGHLCLSDFGQARQLPASSYQTVPSMESLSPTVGTRWYRAPELLFGSHSYTAAVDLWSAGCVFAEVLTRKPLFPGNSDIDQICKIREVLGTLDEHVWDGVKSLPDWGKLRFGPKVPMPWTAVLDDVNVDPKAVDLLGRLIEYNPEKRITAANALHHDYFQSDPRALTAGDDGMAINHIIHRIIDKNR